MSISSTTARNDYTGAGSTATYAYSFKIFANTELLVTVRHPTTYVETTLALTTDYTVTGVGETSGGNVVLVNSSQAWLTSGNLTTDWRITIRHVPPLTQSTDIRNQGDFYPEAHENQFDKLVHLAQEIDDRLDRALKLKETEAGTAAFTAIPVASERASKVLGFDASGNLEMVSNVPTSGVSASSFMQTVLDDTTAAAARTTLGIDGSSAVVTNGDLASSAIAQVCQGRLTLASGTAVATSDQTAKTTIYFTPYGGDKVAVYNGTKWLLDTFTEISIAVPASTNQMYDLFVYDSSGTLTLEALAWTNDTTRATALTTQNGVLVKTGATTRRYVGSFRTTGASGETEDSLAKRYVWNYYNRMRRPMKVVEATNSWTYTTATLRQANNAAANQLDMVIGVSEDLVEARAVSGIANTNVPVAVQTGIGLDSTSANSAQIVDDVQTQVANQRVTARAEYQGFPGVGRHYLAWLEMSAATGTSTWYGDNNSTTVQCGIHGVLVG